VNSSEGKKEKGFPRLSPKGAETRGVNKGGRTGNQESGESGEKEIDNETLQLDLTSEGEKRQCTLTSILSGVKEWRMSRGRSGGGNYRCYFLVE